MPHEIEILRDLRLPAVDATRLGKMDRFITYRTADGHVGAVKMPEEGFSDDRLKAAIAQDLKSNPPIVGKRFTL